MQTVSAKKLDKIADKNQLPSELGGSVNYNHRMWINNRIDFESFVQSADNILAVSSPDDNRVQDLNKAAVADCCEKGKINKLKWCFVVTETYKRFIIIFISVLLSVDLWGHFFSKSFFFIIYEKWFRKSVIFFTDILFAKLITQPINRKRHLKQNSIFLKHFLYKKKSFFFKVGS